MHPSRSRHAAADRVAKAASDGFALVETERSAMSIRSARLLTRFTSWQRSCEDCVETTMHRGVDY